MIIRRLMRYGITFLVILLVLSLFSIYKHWDELSACFASSISSLLGVGLYFLIFGLGIWMIIKSVFK